MGSAAKLLLPAFLFAVMAVPAARAESAPRALVLAQASDEAPAEASPELDGADEAPAPKPDTKAGAENGPPPKSAEETKQNRLGADAFEAPQSKRPATIARPQLLAELYAKLKTAPDFGKARTIMDAIEKVWLTSESDTATLLMQRAARFVSEKEEDLELAGKIADAAVELAPNEAEAWYLRARVHFVQRDYVQAIPNLRRALNADPKHYKALNDLGISLEELGAKKDALDAFHKAIEVNPFMDQTRAEMNLLARELGEQKL
jgi:tetratricopeptide (TPR) repeat protein